MYSNSKNNAFEKKRFNIFLYICKITIYCQKLHKKG